MNTANNDKPSQQKITLDYALSYENPASVRVRTNSILTMLFHRNASDACGMRRNTSGFVFRRIHVGHGVNATQGKHYRYLSNIIYFLFFRNVPIKYLLNVELSNILTLDVKLSNQQRSDFFTFVFCNRNLLLRNTFY